MKRTELDKLDLESFREVQDNLANVSRSFLKIHDEI